MSAIDELLNTALAEVGYHEKASNSQLDDNTANSGSGNWTKYARDLDNISNFYNGAKNGYAWCDVFTDWCFVKTFGASNAMAMLYQPASSAGAGCTYSLQYYQQHGAFTQSPQPGDQIFFGTVQLSTHTGIVYKVDSSNVYTVEGNTSDGVYKRSYSLGSANIAGYGRPKWSVVDSDCSGSVTVQTEQAASSTTTVVKTASVVQCNTKLPLLKKGATGESVKAMQTLLNLHGASLEVDGDFGSGTAAALKAFQNNKGLEADAECGPLTWAALIGG